MTSKYIEQRTVRAFKDLRPWERSRFRQNQEDFYLPNEEGYYPGDAFLIRHLENNKGNDVISIDNAFSSFPSGAGRRHTPHTKPGGDNLIPETISKDSTAGQEANFAHLLAELGKKNTARFIPDIEAQMGQRPEIFLRDDSGSMFLDAQMHSKPVVSEARRREISVGPIDFESRREHIRLKYSKSLKESQAKKARQRAAEKRLKEMDEAAKAEAVTEAATKASMVLETQESPGKKTLASVPERTYSRSDSLTSDAESDASSFDNNNNNNNKYSSDKVVRKEYIRATNEHRDYGVLFRRAQLSEQDQYESDYKENPSEPLDPYDRITGRGGNSPPGKASPSYTYTPTQESTPTPSPRPPWFDHDPRPRRSSSKSHDIRILEPSEDPTINQSILSPAFPGLRIRPRSLLPSSVNQRGDFARLQSDMGNFFPKPARFNLNSSPESLHSSLGNLSKGNKIQSFGQRGSPDRLQTSGTHLYPRQKTLEEMAGIMPRASSQLGP